MGRGQVRLFKAIARNWIFISTAVGGPGGLYVDESSD